MPSSGIGRKARSAILDDRRPLDRRPRFLHDFIFTGGLSGADYASPARAAPGIRGISNTTSSSSRRLEVMRYVSPQMR